MSTQKEEIFKIASGSSADLLTDSDAFNAKRPPNQGGPFALMHAEGGG
jgi:hypothetical protein